MTTKEENKIVMFHIGRGGRFNNQGHLSFWGINEIGSEINDLFLHFKNQDLENKICEQYDCTTEDIDSDLLKGSEFNFKELGELQFYDTNGNSVGLTEKKAETGIGFINIDNDYNSTYTTEIKDLTERELYTIADSNHLDMEEVLKELYKEYQEFYDLGMLTEMVESNLTIQDLINCGVLEEIEKGEIGDTVVNNIEYKKVD